MSVGDPESEETTSIRIQIIRWSIVVEDVRIIRKTRMESNWLTQDLIPAGTTLDTYAPTGAKI